MMDRLSLVMDWGSMHGSGVVNRGGMVSLGDSLVMSGGTVMGSSHVVGLVMAHNVSLSLVSHMDGVLDVMDRGVVRLVDVSDMRVLSVVGLRRFVGGLVVGLHSLVLHNRD